MKGSSMDFSCKSRFLNIYVPLFINPSRPVHFKLWYHNKNKPFETPQRSVKIKI